MNALQRRLLERLRKLRAGTTMCPGQLSRDCGTTLAEARGDILDLAEAGKLTLSQRGRDVASGKGLKGPFRVRLRDG
jgi:hypothetical protein